MEWSENICVPPMASERFQIFDRFEFCCKVRKLPPPFRMVLRNEPYCPSVTFVNDSPAFLGKRRSVSHVQAAMPEAFFVRAWIRMRLPGSRNFNIRDFHGFF